MKKKLINAAIAYAIIAMIFGVFYREFTKFSNFTGITRLSVIHTHYFVLGMFFFLILLVLEHNFGFLKTKKDNNSLLLYHVGLNITGISFLVRGITQVMKTELNTGVDASISGVAGIGHLMLGISIILILLKIRTSVLAR